MKILFVLVLAVLLLASCAQVRNSDDENGDVSVAQNSGGTADLKKDTSDSQNNGESDTLTPATESMPDSGSGADTAPVVIPVTEPPVTDPPVTEPPATEPAPETTKKDNQTVDGDYKYCSGAAKYLEYIKTENLTLVNKQNEVPEDYLPDLYKSTGMMKEAYFALQAMFAQYKSETGKTVSYNPKLAYRSYEYQSNLFAKYTRQEKERHPKYTDEQIKKLVNTYSAIPGQSEHHTGLCLDFTPVSDSFANSAWFKWLSKNAYHFGFILRYGKNQIDITGYKYEPWHWRFVGRDAATEIFTRGITLEEYLGVYPPSPESTRDENELPPDDLDKVPNVTDSSLPDEPPADATDGTVTDYTGTEPETSGANQEAPPETDGRE
ncbi:MAG: D-alanyl-D-alanine carboxypeptidase family protein [Clostridia bacterium]|nr:D-alanyl-D-alanine carboxypeptidase family protein [Clostridia bacterium]